MAAKRELSDTGTDKRFSFLGRKAKSEDGGQGGIRR